MVLPSWTVMTPSAPTSDMARLSSPPISGSLFAEMVATLLIASAVSVGRRAARQVSTHGNESNTPRAAQVLWDCGIWTVRRTGRLGHLAELLDDRLGGGHDAFAEVHRVHAGSNGLAALTVDGAGQYGGGGGAWKYRQATRLSVPSQCYTPHPETATRQR